MIGRIGLARRARQAAENRDDLVLQQQCICILGVLGELRLSVVFDDLNLFSEDAALRVDVVHGELEALGLLNSVDVETPPLGRAASRS